MEHPGEGNTKVGTVPPYLAYRTFTNYVDSLKANGAPPSRIDRSVLGAFSGGVQTQLISALRYLGLTTTEGIPTSNLAQLIELKETDRQEFLQRLMKQAYPYIFDAGFTLHNATTKQLDEKFSHVASGDTVRKCVSFFLMAAKDAGFQMSPYLKVVKAKRGPSARGRKAAPGSGMQQFAPPPSPPRGGGESDDHTTWQQLLLAKFPSFDPAWPDDVKAKWFDAFDKLMKQGQGGKA